MSAAQWFLLAGFAVFIMVSAYMIARSLLGGGGGDLAVPKGRPAVLYSLTCAMLPWKKESARLHAAVYLLGVGYHIGTFLSFFWMIALFFDANLPAIAASASAGLLGFTSVFGVVLALRRITNSKLRYFSSPDDYFSNLVVTGFQALTLAVLLDRSLAPTLFVYGGILLLYIPVGKLRHALYFASARFHLGLFYGRRGVWSVKGDRSWRQ